MLILGLDFVYWWVRFNRGEVGVYREGKGWSVEGLIVFYFGFLSILF